MNFAAIAAVLIVGFSVGSRTFTAAAVIAWAAHLGFLHLNSTLLSFMASTIAVGLFSFAALFEYVVDVLPKTPSRTTAPQLIGRFIFGTFSAACLLAAAATNMLFCVLGGATAVASAFAGYQIRTRLGRSLRVEDAFIAIPEDVISLGLAVLAVSLL